MTTSWKGGEWEDVEVTAFGDPVRRTISTRPSADAIVNLACAAYVRGDIEAETLDRIVGIALGLEDGDVAILSAGEVVLPTTRDDHFAVLERLDARFAGRTMPDWAVERWNLSARAIERLDAERALQPRELRGALAVRHQAADVILGGARWRIINPEGL